MTVVSRASLLLAIAATGTAVTLSILAGLERGGTVEEQAVWIALGVVLVFSAHLLPALTREGPLFLRGIGSVLWLACMAATCYGHAEFFLLAQQHAGERRVSSVTAPSPVLTERNLTIVMNDRAGVTAELAAANAIRCKGDCRTMDGRRTTLAAKLDALDTQASELRRNTADGIRDATHRESLRADPVTSRLATLLGTTVARADLLSGLAFAAILEGVACLLWVTGLRSAPRPTQARVVPQLDFQPTLEPAVDEPSNPVPVASREAATASHEQSNECVPSPPEVASTNDDLFVIAENVKLGRLRPTVAEIRTFLRCSQARAVALRRQLLDHPT